MTLKRKILASLAAVLALLGGILAWHLWPALSPPQHIEVGSPVGTQVPVNMRLRDAMGRETSLADHMGENGAVLLLVRSADWCPFCIMQLKDHADIADELEDRGYRLASLSYDAPAKLEEFSGELARPFTMLSDTDSIFIDAVGLRDPQYSEGHFAYGVPRASVLVLAPDGTITAKLVSADYRQRPSNEFLLSLIE